MRRKYEPATPGASLPTQGSTAEREANSKKSYLENCSSQGQDLALTVLSVPNSLESWAPESGGLLAGRLWVVRVRRDDGELRPWHYIYEGRRGRWGTPTMALHI